MYLCPYYSTGRYHPPRELPTITDTAEVDYTDHIFQSQTYNYYLVIMIKFGQSVAVLYNGVVGCAVHNIKGCWA